MKEKMNIFLISVSSTSRIEYLSNRESERNRTFFFFFLFSFHNMEFDE